MKMRPNISHYCQKCLAANPLGQEFCTRCGTRLMIVVEPSSARFESGPTSLTTDEHLLERISAAENRVARLADRLERSLDLLLRYAQNAYFDRSLIRALVGLLTEDGVVETERLERMWSERCQRDTVEHEENVHRDELRARINAAANMHDKQVFEQLVNEGFVLLEDKQVPQGIIKLQRAAELAQDNAPLNLFIGEHFFRRGKTKQARAYLAKAHAALPDDLRISLLLGLTCADDGEVALAKDLLSSATAQGGSSFAGHYGLGWVFVAEKKWRRALGEFKRALIVRPSAEAHYVLGCLYFELNRDALAVRHLRKATEMDAGYTEAFSLLAQAYERTGHKELAREALEKAGRKNAGLFQVPKSGALRLMAGADKRLAAALREDALATDFTNGL
ncbi:MAG TPA: tetratricopeptide repeat protein [Pyrinomonadaceae bacterium]|jgi:tetratricopeptide (TPR) repeat protein|nr:tetratricopeptide repeat protein [Pyrinomonadaceae bacterium]